MKPDLPPIRWDGTLPLLSRRGPLPEVTELGPLEGLAAWIAAGGDPEVLR